MPDLCCSLAIGTGIGTLLNPVALGLSCSPIEWAEQAERLDLHLRGNTRS